MSVETILSETRVTVAEAARLIPGTAGNKHVGVGAVYRWIHAGVMIDGRAIRLVAVNAGGHWVTSREAVMRFIEATTAAAMGGGVVVTSPAETKRKSSVAGEKLRKAWGGK